MSLFVCRTQRRCERELANDHPAFHAPLPQRGILGRPARVPPASPQVLANTTSSLFSGLLAKLAVKRASMVAKQAVFIATLALLGAQTGKTGLKREDAVSGGANGVASSPLREP